MIKIQTCYGETHTITTTLTLSGDHRSDFIRLWDLHRGELVLSLSRTRFSLYEYHGREMRDEEPALGWSTLLAHLLLLVDQGATRITEVRKDEDRRTLKARQLHTRGNIRMLSAINWDLLNPAAYLEELSISTDPRSVEAHHKEARRLAPLVWFLGCESYGVDPADLELQLTCDNL